MINEVDADTPGTDAAEFVELFDGGTGNTALDDYVLVFFNGNGAVSYAAYDLDGLSTDANGYFVAGNTGVNGATLNFSGNFLQNGADAVALYLGTAASFPNGTAATTADLVDAIAYDTDDSDAAALLTGLGLSVQYNENENGQKDSQSISRLPDGGSSISTVDATPGAANPTPSGALAISLDVSSIPEDGSASITGTVTAPSAVNGDVTVTVIIDDSTEAMSFDTTIFDGDTEGTFFIDAVDDQWQDGDQIVTVTVEAVTYDPDSETFTVTDDDTGFLLAINEVYNAIDGNMYDANGDGTADTDDEFIEIVNLSGGALDISGVTISDSSFERHVFPQGTVLGPNCSIVVFAGGDIPQGSTAAFGNAEVQFALSNPLFPGLFLTDTGDVVILSDPLGSISAGGELHSLVLPDQSLAATAESITASTDLDPIPPYVLHTTTPSGLACSPGTFSDVATTPFCVLTDTLTVTFNVADVSESAGTVVGGGTVSVPAPVSADLTVYFTSSDTTELDGVSIGPVTIAMGTSSADFDLFPVDDLDTDGPQTTTLTARASGYLNGSGSIDVTDDDTTPYTPPNLIITEIMHNPAGSEPATEWIEIYNADSEAVDLGGVTVGDEDAVFGTLPTVSLPAGEYAVIYNASLGSAADVRTDWGIPAGALVIGVSSWDSLANSPSLGNEVVKLFDAFANLLDEVDYDDGGDWPSDPNGISRALVSTAYDDASNDSGTNWVLSTDASQSNAVSPAGTLFSTSDVGSPGFDGTGAGNTFASWIAGFGGATDTTAEGTNDFDGPNVLDAFFGTDPTVTDSNGVQPVGKSGNTFTFRHKLADTAVTDLTATYQWSPTLAVWTDDGVAAGPITVTFGTPTVVDPGDANFDIVEVVATVTGGTLNRLFVRIEATVP
ncbi:endonuclease I [Haloferula helveola]|uniref:Endonuclease I n=1 Tax=Haloferula helveola TaxID=490095 RepID=A0ABM7RJP4_9BACT|nr:endonuclease I [Haloferula helveola]